MQDAITLAHINLLPIGLIFLFPVGLLLLLSSRFPEHQAPAAAVNLGVAWAVSVLAYFVVGFAFQFGGIAQVTAQPGLRSLYWEWYPLDQSVDIDLAHQWGLIALQGWLLTGPASTPAAQQLFLSHAALLGLITMLPASLFRHRTTPPQMDLTTPAKFPGLLIGLLSGAIIYPLAGNWLWGGGWLFHVGRSLGWGQGVVDFGGASVIFLAGSTAALAGLLVFPPSPPADTIPPTDNQPLSPPMPSAYLPLLSLLGGGLMVVGWFGMSLGVHLPPANDFSPTHSAVAGLLTSLTTMLTVALYSWFTTNEFNPLMATRGLVAGLILVTAGGPFIPLWLLVLVGVGWGFLLPSLIYLFEHRLSLRDQTGIVATYGLSAIVSLLLVALFADGQAGQGWNSLTSEATGPGVSRGVSQLQAQLLGIGVVGLWAFGLSWLGFWVSRKIINRQST